MRRLARNFAVVLATICLAAVLWQIREGVVLFVLSLAIAAAVRPTVDLLVQRRWPKHAALVLTYLAGVALVAVLLLALHNPLTSEARRASNALLADYERLTSSWAEGTVLERALTSRLPPTGELSEAISGERGLALAQTALGFTWNLFENVVRVILVLVLSIYWSLDRTHFENLWLSLVPGDLRAEMRGMWHDMEQGIGGYVRSELVQAAFAGLLLWGGYYLLGLDYVLLLAMIGALACLLPWVGVVVALVPACCVGWHEAAGTGIAAAFYTIGVFVVLEYLVEPRLFDARRYNALLAALVALALAELFGLVGLVVGPAIAVALQIYFGHWLRRSTPPGDLSLDLISLERRLAELRASLEQTEIPPPELVSMLERLTALVRDTGSVLEVREHSAPA